MKSARINFGIPESEYILEVDDSGAATSLVNQDTGTEYVGGGGGGDFSTAQVTINFVGFDYPTHMMYVTPICVEENEVSEGAPACIVAQFTTGSSGVYKVPLYKGNCIWYDFYNIFGEFTINLSGDLFNLATDLVITGDGTITITSE